MTSSQHHRRVAGSASSCGWRQTMPASFQRIKDQWLSTHSWVASSQPASLRSSSAARVPRSSLGCEGTLCLDLEWNR